MEQQEALLQQQFEQAVRDSKELPERPSNDVLLQLYGLYKQATAGNAPEKGTYGMFDFAGKAKHEAWLKLAGMKQQEAMQQYINIVNSLKQS